MYNTAVFKARRKRLLEIIKQRNPGVRQGALLLIAGFEDERVVFRQESSFYYLTGIEEAGAALVIDLGGKETLFVPCYADNRAQWVTAQLSVDQKTAERCGVDAVEHLGEAISGFITPLLGSKEQYAHLCTLLEGYVKNQGSIFTLNAQAPRAYVQQKIVVERLACFVGGLESAISDIASLVAHMRRNKSKEEIELLYKAVEITMIAQQGAACALEDGKREYELQAGVEYVFKESGAAPAFPSIVATGKNTTMLHYTPSHRVMKDGDLVVVDIGAEVDYYCADITRTYPVSGQFTKRQREVYRVVFDTQEYVAQHAGPGYWLNNKQEPSKSLHHLAVQFLEKRGYSKYFAHGIGHFLGLDVHDVGDVNEPLREGDVITIEPGIYIPEESLGIRIEDDFWIVKDGVVCLSQELPKDPDTIEEMAQVDFSDEPDDEEFE